MSYKEYNQKLFNASLLKKEYKRQRNLIKQGVKNPFPNFIHNIPDNIKGLSK